MLGRVVTLGVILVLAMLLGQEVFAQSLSQAAAITLLGRAFERVLVVCVSGLSLYFGYRLFERPTGADGDLQAGSAKLFLKMSHVAPGVFFALFGAVILVWVVRSAIDVNGPADGSAGSVQVRNAMPFTADGLSDQDLVRSLNTIEQSIAEGVVQPAANREALARAVNTVQLFKRPIVDQRFGAGTYDWWRQFAAVRETDPAVFLNRLTSEQRAKFAAVDEFVTATLGE